MYLFVRLLIPFLAVLTVSAQRFESIHAAASAGNVAGVRAALTRHVRIDKIDRNGDTALHRAVRAGSVPVVDFLIKHKADLNIENNRGQTPLYLAVERLRESTAVQDERVYYQIGSLLLQAGANPNSVDIHGDTPLHVHMGQYRSEKKETRQHQKHHGRTMHVHNRSKGNYTGKRAVQEEVIRMPQDAAKGKLFLVPLLLAAGANPNAVNVQGSTPLHRAAREGYVTYGLQLLKKVPLNKVSPHHIVTSWSPKVNVHIRDNGGKTPLHWAALKGHYDLVDAILFAGGDHDVNAPDKRGRTPLQWVLRQRGKGAIFYGVGYHMPAEHAYKLLELLLRYGADPLAKDREGISALQWSMRRPLTNRDQAIAEQNLLRSYAD